MKQPEIKSAGLIQMVSATFLAAVLFLSFGCTSSGVKPTREGSNIVTDRVFFSVDKFFEEAIGVKTRNYKINETLDMYGRTETGIETYENYDNPLSPVTIAVNGVLMAKSPTDACLNWVKESTPIYIGGKKSTLEEFRALKEGNYSKIYFYRPNGNVNRETMSFVYVAKEKYEVPEYNYTVTIDKPKLDERDIISPHGIGFYPNVFIYQTDKYNVATPDAKFVVNGEFVDYQVFREYGLDERLKNYKLLVYRNEAAKKTFGDDSWEVIEFNSIRKNLWLEFSNTSNGIVPTIHSNGAKQATYDEIKSEIARLKEINKANGEFTFITIKADTFVTDSIFNDFMFNCIDTADPDIVLNLMRFRRVETKDKNGNTFVRITTE